MSQFYNPYQFIPVTGEINGAKVRADYTDVQAGRHAFARHDIWHVEGISGRILCSLHLHSPTIVGAQQQGEAPKRVMPYTWRGKHAIPGNSLKGMVGSIAEALSQSALRVLDKHENVPKSRPPKRWTVGLPVEGSNRPEPHPVKVNTHQYFTRIDPDVVPWRRTSSQQQRNRLTPAELLFGVVEDNEQGASDDPGRNLAGRVRFHDALPLSGNGETDPEATLKILSSPYLTGDKKAGKQCVPFYFHHRDERGGYIGKWTFYEAEYNDDILPNGRKWYLQHHRPALRGANDWQAPADYERKTDKQRLRCAPLKAGQTFLFHIDFDNLSAAELTLLERALAPAPGFCHRLGLGKPLGLGTISISVEAVLPINRHSRYGAGTFEQHRRYSSVWRPASTPPTRLPAAALAARYAPEAEALQSVGRATKPAEHEDTGLIDSETLAILITLGDVTKLNPDAPVRTPFTPTQATSAEGKSYDWFNENDRSGGQALRPIRPGETLPPLYSNHADARRAGVCFDANVGRVADESAGPRLETDVADWFASELPGLFKATGAKSEDDLFLTAPAAKAVARIHEVDLRTRVFAELVRRWRQTGLPPSKSKVRKIYAGAGLDVSQADSDG